MNTLPQTRRDFLRALLLAGIGAVAWVLLRRSCAGNDACNGCTQYAGCALPWKAVCR
ncbi:MAG: hypothetical protein WCH84_10935 [Verrucomicrobiota bacterium]